MNNQDQKIISANNHIQKQFYGTEIVNDLKDLSEKTHQNRGNMEVNIDIQNHFYSDKKRDDDITFYSNNNMAAVFLNENEKGTD